MLISVLVTMHSYAYVNAHVCICLQNAGERLLTVEYLPSIQRKSKLIDSPANEKQLNKASQVKNFPNVG